MFWECLAERSTGVVVSQPAVDVQDAERKRDDRAQLFDQRALPAAALAHDDDGQPVLDPQLDREHLQQVVDGHL